ncbi:hypothetical protein [Halobacteriovorax sp. BALOs_7]|uniref:hypothetical protein n=1 Tax=Halobacteriovorax sp. BALOs_7 TaxID=2109558 RepID=UPI0013C41439|nr:hypothetical protein [Halobacteriovorax sp. BALOs_7]
MDELFEILFAEQLIDMNKKGDGYCPCCNERMAREKVRLSSSFNLIDILNSRFKVKKSSYCNLCTFHFCLITSFEIPEGELINLKSFLTAYTISMKKELGEFLEGGELECLDVIPFENFENLERRNELLSLYCHVFNNVYDIHASGKRLWRLNTKHWHEITNWIGTRFHRYYQLK